MNHLINFKVFESKSYLELADYAWLYLLVYPYDGVMFISKWVGDGRMGKGTSPEISFNKFNFINIGDETYTVNDINMAKKVLDKEFGAKTFEDSLRKSKLLPAREKFDHFSYPMNKIPYDMFMYKNPKIGKAFDTIEYRFTDHWNSQRSSSILLDKFAKSRRISEYNFENYFENFPDEPKTFKIYRGIKSEYDPYRGEGGYSCWTTDKDQGIRFAKHIFTGQLQLSPKYSDKSILLSTEVSLEDVSIFIGGTESEVVVRNPVSNVTVEKLDTGKVSQ